MPPFLPLPPPNNYGAIQALAPPKTYGFKLVEPAAPAPQVLMASNPGVQLNPHQQEYTQNSQPAPQDFSQSPPNDFSRSQPRQFGQAPPQQFNQAPPLGDYGPADYDYSN